MTERKDRNRFQRASTLPGMLQYILAGFWAFALSPLSTFPNRLRRLPLLGRQMLHRPRLRLKYGLRRGLDPTLSATTSHYKQLEYLVM